MITTIRNIIVDYLLNDRHGNLSLKIHQKMLSQVSYKNI